MTLLMNICHHSRIK